MKRIRAFIEILFSERPNRTDNIFVGMFQVVMGAFLMLPQDSFAPTLKIGQAAVYPGLEEYHFAIVMISLGAVQVALAAFKKWNLLRIWSLPTAVFWSFVTFGYYLALPVGTPLITSAMFTIWIIYQFLELSYWVAVDNLRDKKNIGTI